MEKQAVKCKTCGNPYEVKSDCATNQAICPACRWAGKSPKDKPEPLDYSGLLNKFNTRDGRNDK